MDLLTSALIVSFGIALFTALPWFFQGVRRFSKPLLIVGTVILFGVCFFDLVPEMYEIGGVMSLFIMLGAWAVFAGVHSLMAHEHQHHGDHKHSHGAHSHAGSFLLASMGLHCFAGGMLLVSAYEISETLAFHVFLGLIAHKGFEAISLASVLIDRVQSRKQAILYATLYALSFPAGVALTMVGRAYFFEGLSPEAIEQAAMIITSLAVGSLFGCLLQDFLIPTIRELRASALRLSRVSTAA